MSLLSDRWSEALSDRLGDRLTDRLPRPRLPRRPSVFPWAAPRWPASIPMPPPERATGMDFDTEWSRHYGIRVARAVLLDYVTRPLVRSLVPPVIEGVDRLDGVAGPVIFAANHSSHLDTPLILSVLPRRFRHHMVVAGAADYFFDTRIKGAVFAFSLAAIPFERTRVSRRSLDLAAELLRESWSILIYPEGGRSPDGWAQRFSAGAAYLSIRTAAPMIPVHVEGTGRALAKGARALRPGPTAVTFGAPVVPEEGEDARHMAVRMESEVAALADEHRTDWWQARQRSRAGTSPPLGGPDAAAWRRAWSRPVPSRGGPEAETGTPWSRR